MADQTVSGLELWHWRKEAQQQAVQAGISDAEVDWLLREIADIDRLALRLESFKDWSEVRLKVSLNDLGQLWQQRLDLRVPVQYLAGVTSWRRFALLVSPAVLIPRPETESLIDLAVRAVEQGETHLKQGHWADLGTGSGAIALGLADAFPSAPIHAVDVSVEALAIAQQNAQRLNLNQHIQFYQGAWFHPLEHLRGKLSGMVSNPPYIPSSMVPDLQPEVARHEPHLALDGGPDGLDCIRHLVATAPDYLQPGGIWLIEMMAGQGEAVENLLKQQGSYRNIQIHTDFAGLDRFAIAHRR